MLTEEDNKKGMTKLKLSLTNLSSMLQYQISLSVQALPTINPSFILVLSFYKLSKESVGNQNLLTKSGHI